jgi:hypothetical protein
MLARLAFALALQLVPAHAAMAATARTPAAGAPALQIDVPDGWSVQQGPSGALAIVAADRSGGVMVVLVDGAAPSLSSLAADLARGEHADLRAGSAPAAIDGRRGEAYVAIANYPNRAPSTYHTVLVTLDTTHVAVLSTLSSSDATPVQLQAIDAAAATVKIIGAK